nr:hypothetical protein [Tanacetum cinerariifolium]
AQQTSPIAPSSPSPLPVTTESIPTVIPTDTPQLRHYTRRARIAHPPGTGVPTGGVPTGSDVVPTASPIFTTATVATPYTRRKGKEKMVESDTPKKKLQEQIDVQFDTEMPIERRIELISNLVKYQDNYAKVLKF